MQRAAPLPAPLPPWPPDGHRNAPGSDAPKLHRRSCWAVQPAHTPPRCGLTNSWPVTRTRRCPAVHSPAPGQSLAPRRPAVHSPAPGQTLAPGAAPLCTHQLLASHSHQALPRCALTSSWPVTRTRRCPAVHSPAPGQSLAPGAAPLCTHQLLASHSHQALPNQVHERRVVGRDAQQEQQLVCQPGPLQWARGRWQAAGSGGGGGWFRCCPPRRSRRGGAPAAADRQGRAAAPTLGAGRAAGHPRAPGAPPGRRAGRDRPARTATGPRGAGGAGRGARAGRMRPAGASVVLQ